MSDAGQKPTPMQTAEYHPVCPKCGQKCLNQEALEFHMGDPDHDKPTHPVDIEHDIENSGVDIASPVDGELRSQINELRRQNKNFGFQLEPGDKKLSDKEFVDAIMQLFTTYLQAAVQIAELKKEIKIHDNYWHLQHTVEKQGIGPVALEFKEAAEKVLQQLNQGGQESE